MPSPRKPHPSCDNKNRDETGRPIAGAASRYTEEFALHICNRIASNPYGIKKLCAMYNDLPGAETIRRWMIEKPEFREQYLEAKRLQAHILADSILDVVEDDSQDIGIDQDGKEIHRPIVLNRHKLNVESKKWLVSSLLPKVYGNGTQLEEKTAENEKLQLELAALRAKLDEANRKDY